MTRLSGAAVVFLLAVLPWWPLGHGQFLFDDLQLIETNPALAAVTSLTDALTFSLKPSKPVANTVLALAHWWGRGRIEGQRALSLGLHGAVAALLFWLLLGPVPPLVAGLGALWFAWAPLHAEALAIAWFRMDVLGTVFALLAAVLAQRGRWVAAFLAVGAAALSKEVFVLLAPVAVVAATGRRRALWFALPWGLVVLGLLYWDSTSAYSYRGVIGFAAVGARQLFLAPLASAEWAAKIFSGFGLTTTSLLDRWQSAPSVMWALSMGCLGLGLWLGLWLLARSRQVGRGWAAAALFSLLLYAVIPNLNLGAERYGYFSAACLAAVLAFSVTTTTRKVFPFLLGLHDVFLLFPMQVRIGDLETRLAHYFAELRHHPEVGTNWSNAAMALVELPGDSYLQAEPLLARAKQLAGQNPRVSLAEFAYLFRKGDGSAYAELWRQRGEQFSSNARISAGLEFQLGILQARQGSCQAARLNFQSAEQRDASLSLHSRPFCG